MNKCTCELYGPTGLLTQGCSCGAITRHDAPVVESKVESEKPLSWQDIEASYNNGKPIKIDYDKLYTKAEILAANGGVFEVGKFEQVLDDGDVLCPLGWRFKRPQEEVPSGKPNNEVFYTKKEMLDLLKLNNINDKKVERVWFNKITHKETVDSILEMGSIIRSIHDKNDYHITDGVCLGWRFAK